MKRIIILVCALFLISPFGTPKNDAAEYQYSVSNFDVTVLKVPNVLRYDFEITNDNPKKALKRSKYRSPHHYPPIDIAIVPGKKLSEVMKESYESDVPMMQLAGSSIQGDLRTQGKVLYSLEYQIKKGANLDIVKKHARDGTLILFDGMDEVAKFRLINE
ncbi:MAG: hypothetical protein ACQEV7_17645 [Bacillota bacterium]